MSLDQEQQNLAAVRLNGWALKDMVHPSRAVIVEAIKEDGYVVTIIDGADEALKLLAVQQNGFVIDRIDNPSEALLMEAVKQNPWAIRYIKSPSNSVLAQLLIHHSGSEAIPLRFEEKAAEILECYQPGLGLAYSLAGVMGYEGEALRDLLLVRVAAYHSKCVEDAQDVEIAPRSPSPLG